MRNKMTREEEISVAALKEYPNYSPGFELAFKEGAKWADKCPCADTVPRKELINKIAVIGELKAEIEELKSKAQVQSGSDE